MLRRKTFMEFFSTPLPQFSTLSFFTLYPLSKTPVLRKIRKVFIVQHQQCYISREEIKLYSPKKKKGLFLCFFLRFLLPFSFFLHHQFHGYNLTFWLCMNITIQHSHSISLYHHQIVLNVLFLNRRSIPPFSSQKLSSAIELFSKVP
jgi:hypothetical protein